MSSRRLFAPWIWRCFMRQLEKFSMTTLRHGWSKLFLWFCLSSLRDVQCRRQSSPPSPASNVRFYFYLLYQSAIKINDALPSKNWIDRSIGIWELIILLSVAGKKKYPRKTFSVAAERKKKAIWLWCLMPQPGSIFSINLAIS